MKYNNGDMYKGIRIIWDEDYDKRIFEFIDILNSEELKNIYSVGEHEGCLEITWKNNNYVSERLNKFFELNSELYGYDYWNITNNSIETEFPEDYFIKRTIDVKRIITPQQRYECLKRQSWKCNFCLTRLKYNSGSLWEGQIAHIDHIHPFSKKESYLNGEENINEDSNLQALCPKCNLGKNKNEIN